jgi:hypothetical protein
MISIPLAPIWEDICRIASLIGLDYVKEWLDADLLGFSRLPDI